LAGQRLLYLRTLKGDRRLDVTEQAADQSKDATNEGQKEMKL
jgi:hypothetical protein